MAEFSPQIFLVNQSQNCSHSSDIGTAERETFFTSSREFWIARLSQKLGEEFRFGEFSLIDTTL